MRLFVALGIAILPACSSTASVRLDAADGADAATALDGAAWDDASVTAPDALDLPDSAPTADAPGGTRLDPSTLVAASMDTRTLPRDVRRTATDLRVSGTMGPITLYTRAASSMTEADRNQFLSRALRALAFDIEELRIDPTSVLATEVRLVVLDVESYNRATQAEGTYGVAYPATRTDSDAMVVPENALADLGELDDTLAHEQMHVIQARVAGDADMFPWYFSEGMAVDVGARFGIEVHGRVSSFVTSYLGARGPDARTTFTRYAFEDRTTTIRELGHDQALGGLFVQYLAAKHPRGEDVPVGFPDANARLLQVYAESFTESEFATSFESHFDGLTVTAAQEAFTAFLDTGSRTTRWAGTVYGTR